MTSFGSILLIIGGVLAIYGVTALDNAPDIVGGDAYNYIIGAVRGVGWIAAGGVSALVGVGFMLLDRNLDAQAAARRTVPETSSAGESPFAISQE